MALKLVYPQDADDDFKKYFACYKMQQMLQDEFNRFGKDFRDKKITMQAFEEFKKNWYQPRMDLVVKEVLRLRESAKIYDWNITLDELFMS